MNVVSWTCPSCGVQANVPIAGFPVHCRCGFTQMEYTPGLGDIVAAGLASVGITKERYVRAKVAVGLKRDCGCLKRQKRLNELGRKIGIGVSE
jgi:hypothetical protein